MTPGQVQISAIPQLSFYCANDDATYFFTELHWIPTLVAIKPIDLDLKTVLNTLRTFLLIFNLYLENDR